MDWACGGCTTEFDWLFNGTINWTNNTISGSASLDNDPTETFTGAQSTTALPVKYFGSIAMFSNSCLLTDLTHLCPSLGSDQVQAALGVDGNFNVTATLILSGADNGVFTLSGLMIGNTIQVSGTIGTQQVELVGYFDIQGLYGGSPESLIVFQIPYPISPPNWISAYSGTLNHL